MNIEPTVSLGSIINIVSMIIVVVVAFMNLKAHVEKLHASTQLQISKIFSETEKKVDVRHAENEGRFRIVEEQVKLLVQRSMTDCPAFTAYRKASQQYEGSGD